MRAEYGANQFAAAGKVPALQSVDAIVVYDPKNGRVRHIHQVLVFKGGNAFVRLAAEKEALSQAEALGHRTASLRTLHVPDFREIGALYRVDVEKQTLIKTQAFARTKEPTKRG